MLSMRHSLTHSKMLPKYTIFLHCCFWIVVTTGSIFGNPSDSREFEVNQRMKENAKIKIADSIVNEQRYSRNSDELSGTNSRLQIGPKLDLFSRRRSIRDVTSQSLRDPDLSADSALNIPGVAGIDYPIFNDVPETDFDCRKQRYKGFFADISSKCQAWHYCDFFDGQSTFLCPNGTLFSQVLLICDWWFNVNCDEAQQLYVLNERLYRLVKLPKPTFPEDFHGPEVDLWLKRQFQLGTLPKISRKFF